MMPLIDRFPKAASLLRAVSATPGMSLDEIAQQLNEEGLDNDRLSKRVWSLKSSGYLSAEQSPDGLRYTITQRGLDRLEDRPSDDDDAHDARALPVNSIFSAGNQAQRSGAFSSNGLGYTDDQLREKGTAGGTTRKAQAHADAALSELGAKTKEGLGWVAPSSPTPAPSPFKRWLGKQAGTENSDAQAKPSQAKPSQAKPSQAKPSQARRARPITAATVPRWAA